MASASLRPELPPCLGHVGGQVAAEELEAGELSPGRRFEQSDFSDSTDTRGHTLGKRGRAFGDKTDKMIFAAIAGSALPHDRIVLAAQQQVKRRPVTLLGELGDADRG